MQTKEPISAVASSTIGRLLSRRQVGDLLGVHEGTVKRWEFDGRLPAIKLNCRVTRYRESDVRKLVEGAAVA